MKRKRKLDYESVKDVKLVIVRKIDWAVSFSTDIMPHLTENWLEISGDDRIVIGSEDAVCAVSQIVGAIAGSAFVVIRETDSYIFFMRRDCLGKYQEIIEETAIFRA